MKLTQRFVLAAVLGAAASLTACDRAGTPGEDRQNINDFSTAPPARSIETNMDSVNGQQNAPEPGGIGSAADQAQSTDNALNSAPAGNSSNSPQAPSGQPNTLDKSGNKNNLNGTQAPSQNSTAPSAASGSTPNTGTADRNGGTGRTQ